MEYRPGDVIRGELMGLIQSGSGRVLVLVKGYTELPVPRNQIEWEIDDDRTATSFTTVVEKAQDYAPVNKKEYFFERIHIKGPKKQIQIYMRAAGYTVAGDEQENLVDQIISEIGEKGKTIFENFAQFVNDLDQPQKQPEAESEDDED